MEDLAIGPHGFAAVTTHGGQLLVFDPAGESTVGFTFDPTDPPLLIEAPEGSPPARDLGQPGARAQWLRGHDLRGRCSGSGTPWEGWSLLRLGRFASIAAADGRALSFDGAGTVHSQGIPTDDPNNVFCTGADGEILRISRHGVHLIGATLDGRVRWRAVIDQTRARSPPEWPARRPCSASRSRGSRTRRVAPGHNDPIVCWGAGLSIRPQLDRRTVLSGGLTSPAVRRHQARTPHRFAETPPIHLIGRASSILPISRAILSLVGDSHSLMHYIWTTLLPDGSL